MTRLLNIIHLPFSYTSVYNQSDIQVLKSGNGTLGKYIKNSANYYCSLPEQLFLIKIIITKGNNLPISLTYYVSSIHPDSHSCWVELDWSPIFQQ